MTRNIFLIFLITIFSLLAYLSIWGTIVAGDIDFEKIYFHLFMPLKNAHTDWAVGLWMPFVATILTDIGIWCGCWHLRENNKSLSGIWVFLCSLVVFDCVYINEHFAIYAF